MEEIAFQDASPVRKRKRNLKKISIITLVVILLLILIFSVIRALSSGGSTPEVIKKSPISSPNITPTPQVESPTPIASSSPSSVDSTSKLDRSSLSIKIENGSGEAGVAGKGSAFLKNLGYDVVASGNADNFNYTGVTVQIKNSKKDYLQLIKKDLSSSYTITSATSDLSEGQIQDALVIIGK